MTWVRVLTAITAAMLGSPAGAAMPAQMQVELIASTMAPRPGSTVLVGFRMAPKPGWHGYWSNAGGSGIAPTVSWSASAGVKFGPLLHPAPKLLKSLGVVTYVHSGEHVLVSRMAVPAKIAAGTAIPVRADLNWAVCSDTLCVPASATFSLAMVAGSGAVSRDAAVLNRALSRVPGSIAGGSYWTEGGKLTLALPDGVRLRAASARFFPDENGFFDTLQARASDGAPVRIAGPLTSKPPARITGVVSDGTSSYRLSLLRGAPPKDADEAHNRSPPAASDQPAAAPTRSTPVPPQEPGIEGPPATSPNSLPLALVGGLLVAALLLYALARRRP